MDKNLSANVGDNVGFDLWSGKISRAVEKLSSCATAEACCLELCSTAREATAVRSACTATREWPLVTITTESPQVAMKTQCSQK